MRYMKVIETFSAFTALRQYVLSLCFGLPEGKLRGMMGFLPACILAALICCGSPLTCCAATEELFVPWDYNTSTPKNELKAPKEELSPGASALLGAIRFYQRFISPVIEARCPMTPTCSAYAVEAIRKHGFFIGYMMTADRLIHEGDEKRYTRAIVHNNKVSFYDPVANNDFWFVKDDKSLRMRKERFYEQDN